MPERADNSPKWIVRRTAKAALAGALCAAGARWVVGAMRRREAGGSRVLILSYHRATLDFEADAADSLPSLLVSAETLHRQITQIAREREIVSLAEACRRLMSPAPEGRGARMRDAAVITFDDGYVGVHRHALPVLQDLQVPATVFVATGYVGTRRRLTHDRLWAALKELWRRRIPPAGARLPEAVQPLLTRCAGQGPATTMERILWGVSHDEAVAIATALEERLGMGEQDLPDETRLMNWEELRELHAAGMEVGGHTVNHTVLSNLRPSRARKEITGCFHDIYDHIRRPPVHFAYPNGLFTPRVRALVREAGFHSAVTTEDLENRRGGDLLSLRRKTLWENSTLGGAGYSSSLAACNLDGVFGALGWQRATSCERPDVPETLEQAEAEAEAEPEREIAVM
jgi:peptidoglycan/xylan/chitin deacetylase (PgdA/CDA1 family)